MDEIVLLITTIVRRLANTDSIQPDEDFYVAGLPSVTALELLIEVESTFAVAIPDDEFVEARTAQSLAAVVARQHQKG